MTFREFVEYAKANARERGERFTRADDDWPMTIIVDHPGEGPYAFDLPGWISNSTQAKHFYAQAMGAAARMTKPTKIAFIASSWQVARSADEPIDTSIPPSQHPDRFEALILVVADAEISEGHMARITRRRYGRPLLDEWSEDVGDVAGPMFDPWRDALR